MYKPTDTEILDFIEKHEPSIYKDSYFTLVTQNVSKKKCKTIREFCTFGINLERMLDANSIKFVEWHSMPAHVQHKIEEIWSTQKRALIPEEKAVIDEEVTEYWKIISAGLNERKE